MNLPNQIKNNGFRNNQKQIWTHKEFAKKLEQIKAKRLLAGRPINNMGELTAEMILCPSFKNLERELINLDKRIMSKLPVNFDGVLK